MKWSRRRRRRCCRCCWWAATSTAAMNEYECATCINTEDADERAESGAVWQTEKEREGGGRKENERERERGKQRVTRLATLTASLLLLFFHCSCCCCCCLLAPLRQLLLLLQLLMLLFFAYFLFTVGLPCRHVFNKSMWMMRKVSRHTERVLHRGVQAKGGVDADKVRIHNNNKYRCACAAHVCCSAVCV